MCGNSGNKNLCEYKQLKHEYSHMSSSWTCTRAQKWVSCVHLCE